MPRRPATSVIGPISLTTILMNRNDVPQMLPRRRSSSRFDGVRTARATPVRISVPPASVVSVAGSPRISQASNVEPMGSARVANDTSVGDTCLSAQLKEV